MISVIKLIVNPTKVSANNRETSRLFEDIFQNGRRVRPVDRIKSS